FERGLLRRHSTPPGVASVAPGSITASNRRRRLRNRPGGGVAAGTAHVVRLLGLGSKHVASGLGGLARVASGAAGVRWRTDSPGTSGGPGTWQGLPRGHSASSGGTSRAASGGCQHLPPGRNFGDSRVLHDGSGFASAPRGDSLAAALDGVAQGYPRRSGAHSAGDGRRRPGGSLSGRGAERGQQPRCRLGWCAWAAVCASLEPMNGSLALVLHAHLPFVRHPEQPDFLEEDWLYEAILEVYLPLLGTLERIAGDQVQVRLTLSLSPTLLAMLADELLMDRCAARFARLCELADKEVRRTASDP